MKEAEVRELFAPLGVLTVKGIWDGHSTDNGAWEVQVDSNYRAVGRFAFENGLLDRIGGSGCYNQCHFFFDNPPWNGNLPKAWLPKAAVTDTRAPALVSLKAALPCKSQWLNDTQLKVLELPFNLSIRYSKGKLFARFLTSGQTFRNQYDDHELTQEQAVELVRRSRHLLTDL